MGTVTVQCAAQSPAASAVTGTATGIVATAGTGVVPAAGVYYRADALAGANAAGGTVGSDATATVTGPLTVVAPAGNSVQITAQANIVNAPGQVTVSAVGQLQ